MGYGAFDRDLFLTQVRALCILKEWRAQRQSQQVARRLALQQGTRVPRQLLAALGQRLMRWGKALEGMPLPVGKGEA